MNPARIEISRLQSISQILNLCLNQNLRKDKLKFSHCEAQLLRVLKNRLLPSLNSSCHMKLYHFNAGLYLGPAF